MDEKIKIDHEQGMNFLNALIALIYNFVKALKSPLTNSKPQRKKQKTSPFWTRFLFGRCVIGKKVVSLRPVFEKE